MTNQHRLLAAMLLVIGLFLTAQPANASTIPVGIGAFGAGSTLTTFNGLADGTEVNGLTVGGILFQYSLGNGQVVIDGGPGVTNNVAPPNIVSIGNPGGVLTLTLPSPVDTFGYGYAILATITTPATFIVLFDGATPVGSQLYTGAPDPGFTGGFAGIQSTLPFNRVQLAFNNVVAPAFAVDNVRTFNSAAVPEPATLTLLGSGIVAAAWRRRRRNGRP
jgi:hypothetical protein